MIDVHLSVELLEAVADGSLSRETFERLALEHALAVSPRARAAVAGAVAAPAPPEPTTAPESYDAVFERVQANAGALLAAKGVDERGAALDFAELLRLPTSAWPSRVQSSRLRFRSPSVAERLLAYAKTALLEGRPAEVLDAARAAFWVARRLEPGHQELQREATLRASAYEAMASRAQGDLTAARRLMESVREARARGDLGGDPLAEIEVAFFEGLFDRDDERFGEAEAEFLVAITTANALGAEVEEGEARLAFARGLVRTEELAEAADVLRSIGSGDLPDPAAETAFSARLELAEILARLDRPRPASSALAGTRETAVALGGDALGRLDLCRGILSARRGWRPEGVRELESAFGRLATESPLLAARAALTIAEAAISAGRPEEASAACDRLRELGGLPEGLTAALADFFARGTGGVDVRAWLADLAAYCAAAHESPGLTFHRAYPGAHRLA